MPSAIFNGSFVKLLKDQLKFKSGGEVYWDYTNGCLAYRSSTPGVSNQIGQETHIRVFNNTGAPILNGAPVYISGANAGAGLPEISKAIASTYDQSRIIGVVTADIATGSSGIVTRAGVVNDLDTTAYNAGDLLYLSPTVAGTFTTTKPTDGNFAVAVGYVSKVDATTGAIIVTSTVNNYTTETLQKTGWSNAYGPATLSFNDLNRTLTLTAVNPTFHFYQMGEKIEKATDSYQITDDEGLHFIYYNGSNLTSILNPTNAQIISAINTYTTVAYVYWDKTNQTGNYVANEFHDMEFPPLVHSWAHAAFGARYLFGLAPNTITADATGALAAHAQFGMDAGGFRDEDLFYSTNSILSTVGYPIYYLAGTSASPTLRRTSNAGFPVITTGSGRMAYNFLTGGNWTLAEVGNLNFALIHVFVINANTTSERVVVFLGQNQYATVALARTGALTEIQTIQSVGIVPAEIKSIATFIYQTADGYANAVKSRIRTTSTGENFVDWRATNTTGGGSGSGGSVNTFPDNLFQIYDDLDPTKVITFQASGLSTGQTRIITMPDYNSTISEIPTWTTATRYSASVIVYNSTDRYLYRSTILHTSGTFATDFANGNWVRVSPVRQLPIDWFNDSEYAALEDSIQGVKRYGFDTTSGHLIRASFTVPRSFVPGNQLNMQLKIHSPTGSGTILMTSRATLLRDGLDSLTDTTNRHVSTNTAVTMTAVDREIRTTLDLSAANGTINSVAVNPFDTILLELYRGSGTNTDKSYIIPSNTGVLL